MLFLKLLCRVVDKSHFNFSCSRSLRATETLTYFVLTYKLWNVVLQLHRKMKTDDEFRYLKSKVGGLQQGYKRIVCILALYPLSSLADSSVVELHPALKVGLTFISLRID